MNTGTMGYLFLSGATLRPHVAYMSAKRRLISVHLTSIQSKSKCQDRGDASWLWRPGR